MKTLTRIGHASIKVGDTVYRLIPSIGNISSLGDPIGAYADAHGERGPEAMLDACKEILLACCDREGLDAHIGLQRIGKTRARPDGRGGFIYTTNYNTSYIDDVHLVCIARDLIHHGMIGNSPERPKNPGSSGGGFKQEFKAEEYAALAMAHLGMSSAEAWSITMTELMQAMHQKFPPTKAEQSQMRALDEYDQAMAWKKRIYGEDETK